MFFFPLNILGQPFPSLFPVLLQPLGQAILEPPGLLAAAEARITHLERIGHVPGHAGRGRGAIGAAKVDLGLQGALVKAVLLERGSSRCTTLVFKNLFSHKISHYSCVNSRYKMLVFSSRVNIAGQIYITTG